ncbi:MAG TPA: hypothetical protein VIJ50_04820 [Solirubrobacteraceae bacterium]
MGDSRGLGLGWLSAVSTLFALLIGGASAAPAYAQNPVWAISSSSSPTNFAPGDETGDDKYVLTVLDAGGGSDAGSPIEVGDTLPTGITASAVSGEDLGNGHALACNLTPKPTCTYEGFEMAPGDVLRIEVIVKVNSGVAASVTNSVSVGGGGAATGAQAEDTTTVSSNQAVFGISDFAATWSDTQAGAAVNLTAGFTFNQIVSGGKTYPAAGDKQAALSLPPGFIANPRAVPYCTIGEASAGSCPLDTAVGVAFTSRGSGGSASVQYSSLVYNTAPELGQLGALTMFLPGVPLRFGMALQPDGQLKLTADDAPVDGLISTTLTLWGVPAAYNGAGPDHAQASGEPDFGDPGGGLPPARFLTSAVSCSAAPDTTLSAESWEAPGVRMEASSDTPTPTGCNRLPFSPSLDVNPDVNYANAPSGYDIDVHLPQPREPGLASAAMESARIALPQGAGISLSAANGLQGCGEAEVGLGSSTRETCPAASMIGTAEIEMPILAGSLKGHVYLARPGENPFHVQLGLYVVAKEQLGGVSVKLAGELENNPIAGRWEISFEDLPQLPIDDLALRFSGGPRALLSTPPTCGTATSTAELEPWSANAAATASSAFQIDSGAQGTQCSAPHPFSPAIVTVAEATSEANTFKSLALMVSRANHDEEQELGTIAIEAPQALAQMFVGVQTCEEPRASEGLCTSTSEVGRVESTVGLGSHPVALDGSIYLTGPYGGAAQSLSIVLPLDPGPFEFGAEVVRAAITVNPSTGALILTSGQLPTLDDGVALHLDEILLLLDRGTFKVDPACEPLGVTGTITSTEGGTAQITSNPLGASTLPCVLPAAPGQPRKGTRANSTVSFSSTHIATNGHGVAKVKLACKGTARCLGNITLTGKLNSTGAKGHAKQEMLGTAHFSLEAGATATIDVKLGVRARSALRFAHGFLRAVLSIRTSSSKPAQTHSVTVQLSTHKIRRHVKR